MEKERLYQVLLVSAGVFGCGAVVLNSWPATILAIGSLVASTVEMFMRRTVFETRLLEATADMRNMAKELHEELTKVKNDNVRILNKLGMSR